MQVGRIAHKSRRAASAANGAAAGRQDPAYGLGLGQIGWGGPSTGPTLFFGAAGVSPFRCERRCGPAALVGRVGGVISY